jgi:hypothetical protein
LLLAAAVVHAAPPKVVKATPDNGDVDVDPALNQIVVVFDQPMNQSGRSITGGGDSFPKIEGQIHWTDARTIVIPVKLEPDHDYRLSMNSVSYRNFTNTAGESAVPYPISFSTAPPNKIAPEVQEQSIAQLRKAIDEEYSYRDLHNLDWDKLFADAAPELEKCEYPKSFAKRAAAMLAAAQDIHVTMRVGPSGFASATRSVPINASPRLAQLIPNWQQPGNGVATGKFEDGIGYLLIAAWSQTLDLNAIYDAILHTDPAKGMIIDVRGNSGGGEDLAEQVAGCFVTEPHLYSKHITRQGGQWSPVRNRMLDPNRARAGYRGKVVVLIGRHCASSNESFILMMKAAGATLVGETTFGSSGNPHPHELANGVTVSLPSWKDLLPDGSLLEGVGIKPDIEVKAQQPDFAQRDAVLEAGLKQLRAPENVQALLTAETRRRREGTQ